MCMRHLLGKTDCGSLHVSEAERGMSLCVLSAAGVQGALSTFAKLQTVTSGFMQELESKLGSADSTEVGRILSAAYTPFEFLVQR